jgi:hypothetical protein
MMRRLVNSPQLLRPAVSLAVRGTRHFRHPHIVTIFIYTT